MSINHDFRKVKSITNGYLEENIYQEIYMNALNAPLGVALDIGPAQGGSTISICLGYKESRAEFHVYSIDKFCKSSALKDYYNIEENINVLQDNLDKYNVRKNVTILTSDRDDITLKDESNPISLLFIDADGAIDRDFSLYYNKLCNGAYIIIDDYDNVINLQSSTHFLKWQSQNQIDCFLCNINMDSLINYTPLGKQYTIYKFVNYFVENGFINPLKIINNTLFAIKQANSPLFTFKTEEDLFNIRLSIEKEFYQRREIVIKCYEEIGKVLPKIGECLGLDNAIMYENYFYSIKQRYQAVKCYEWHENDENRIINDLAIQDISHDKITEFIIDSDKEQVKLIQIEELQNDEIKEFFMNLDIYFIIVIPIKHLTFNW